MHMPIRALRLLCWGCTLTWVLGGQAKNRVLILDVDGTLYDSSCMIEQQIKERCHNFGRRFGLSPDECQKMHDTYGSTIRGLMLHGAPRETLSQYYSEAYEDLDMSRLLKFSKPESDRTGYTLTFASLALRKLSHLHDTLYVASNSPLFHVKRVLARLGIQNLPVAGVLTPDTRQGYTKTDKEFWYPIIERHPPSTNEIVLIDDNANNIEVVKELGMSGILITDTENLPVAITRYLGGLPSVEYFQFSSVEYLRWKNLLDQGSLSKHVWRQVISETKKLLEAQSTEKTFRIVDIGAGVLGMLPKALELIEQLPRKITHVTYLALETNKDLTAISIERLLDQGFTESLSPLESHTELRSFEQTYRRRRIVVQLCEQDFTETNSSTLAHVFSSTEASTASAPLVPSHRRPVDLAIGCCFADLMSPERLMGSVINLVGESGALLYLPITFAGSTEFIPSAPRENSIPRDALVLEAYSEHLRETGHHFSIRALVNTVQAFGGIVLASGESDWHIERSVQKYMWECMRYFIATGVALRMANSWDMRAWFERLERTSPTIVARNVDILAAVVKADTTPVQLEFEICRGGISDLTAQAYDLPMSMLTLTDGQSVKLAPADTFLEFVAPNTVSVTSEAPHELNLGPSEVYIKAECSLISTGTELKIFKGEFESGEALDTTIEAMKDQTLKYPLRYGYSVVGRVVAVGEDVDSSVTGSRVFCFAPHGTGSVASIDSCVHIPDEISSQDAVFLPSVETALSIVQDAQPKLGEVVAVFGQGLIGLLVGSILQRQMLRSEACSDQLVLVDVNDARLAVARDAIPQATYWNPSKDLPLTKEFDVSIEVSGSPKALQTALDSTGYGGRVVVGSWYGARPAALSLGLQLHRSHLTIIMSQVSRVAAVHSDRWDKARRMTLALDMLRQLKPSEWLLGRKIPLTKAALQKAYSDLSAGKELTILIEYS